LVDDADELGRAACGGVGHRGYEDAVVAAGLLHNVVEDTASPVDVDSDPIQRCNMRLGLDDTLSVPPRRPCFMQLKAPR
jgi:hypothetical protein